MIGPPYSAVIDPSFPVAHIKIRITDRHKVGIKCWSLAKGKTACNVIGHCRSISTVPRANGGQRRRYDIEYDETLYFVNNTARCDIKANISRNTAS